MKTLDVKTLRELLSYEADSGVLRWKVQIANCIKVGQRAGRYSAEGYRIVRIRGIEYLEHRIAFALAHGEWPAGVIDHINGVKDDNRLSNIRNATHAINQQNRIRPQRGSKTGVIGVQDRGNGTYQAKINVKGKRIALGTYPTIGEASMAYLRAKAALHEGWVEK